MNISYYMEGGGSSNSTHPGDVRNYVPYMEYAPYMMACGLGACLCCVEKTTEGNLCVCKDGPVFNIRKLLWQV